MTQYVIRYGLMRHVGLMAARAGDSYRRGMEVIARTNRGLEAGQVLAEATPHIESQMSDAPNGTIVRQVTEEDAAQIAQIEAQRPERKSICENHIEALGLDMKLIDTERLFGGERIVVYYLADERVDFRQLVKRLAGEFKTRIEMRQIGVRDEAKLLADYGDCGKPVCCNTHLSSMPPVSMKMAKIQKATLDPTKISGRCGRLKCCLRYEFDTYEEIERQLPRIGAQIVTRDGKGRVLAHNILAEQVLVEMEDHRRILVPAGEILSVISKKSAGKKPKPKNENHR